MYARHPEPVPGTEADVLGRRILAWLLDNVVFWVGIGVLFLLAEWVGPGRASPSGFAVGATAFAGYFWLVLEGTHGRRPGKAAMGLVVVTEDGRPCTLEASVLRNLLWVVDQIGFFPVVVALLVFVTERNQRVGDLAANTVVVAASATGGVPAATGDAAGDRVTGAGTARK